MPYKINPDTGERDYYESLSDIDGIPIGNSTTYFTLNGNTLELWVNGSLRQSWTYTPVAPTIQTGNPIGLLLTLTYQL